MSFLKIVFYAVFFSVFGLLSGCYDSHRPAPVIDGWYQSNAASHFYIVRSDDTIYSIAFSFGLDYRDLVAANHLVPPYYLKPGQRLIMTNRPPSRTAQPASRPIAYSESFPVAQPMMHPLQPAAQYQRQPIYKAHYVFNARWGWPAKGRILQGYSTSPSGRPGISIGGRLGEPIRAAATGVVVYSGEGVRGYGNLIILKHNDSYLSAYADNLRNLVTVGEKVRAGSIIARMGHNDANRTLLYFEIRRDGVPVDPMRFLR